MFQISALPAADFFDLFALDTAALAHRGARRYIADAKPGFPCRISLEDAEPGEPVILVPFQHQQADTPYRASGPIFVRERARTTVLPVGVVPALLRSRQLSLRAYSAEHLMIRSRVVAGSELEGHLGATFLEPAVSYLHVHFAGPGCYICRVDRVDA